MFDAHKDFREWVVEYYRLTDTPYLAETLSDPEKKVLEQVTSKPRKSEAIARSVGKAAGTVRKILVQLTERGLIDNIGSGYFRHERTLPHAGFDNLSPLDYRDNLDGAR